MSPKVALILWKRRHEEWTVMKKASWVVLKLPRRLFAPNGNPTPHLFSHYIFSPTHHPFSPMNSNLEDSESEGELKLMDGIDLAATANI